MTTRKDLLRSSVRLLGRDQTDVTTAFTRWNAMEEIRQHKSVGPAIAAASRRLKRNQDRLFMLRKSYNDGADATADGTALAETGSTEARGMVLPPLPALAERLQQGYRALERLSTRYASVYSLATAIMEPPIANVARSNMRATRELMGELIALLPVVTKENVTATHPDVLVNLDAGPRAQELLRCL